MKKLPFWIGVIPGFLVAIAGVPVAFSGSRPAPDHSHDIAVIDRALATARPTDRWVKFGDVGIKYADLKIYRDRLAGVSGEEKRAGPVNPEAVTPAGTTFKWTGGIVNFRFDPSDAAITPLKKQQFRDGVAEWTAFANLTFNEFTGTPPANYITVQEDPNSGAGFSSSVGMAGGEQLIQFGPNAWNRGTICHEVGHALGLWHEQQRPDRDTYVIINWDNIDSQAQGNFTIIANGQTFGSPYDFYSVMHYARNALAIDSNQDTIIMKAGFTQYANVIGNAGDRILSKAERAAMAAIYGNPSSLPGAVVTNTKDSGPGSLRTSIYCAFDRSPSSSPSPAPPAATTITFNIPTNDPGHDNMTGLFTIKPTAPLPSMGNGTTINGNAQIVLDGSTFAQLQAPPLFIFSHGLSVAAANCTIKGLVIQNFNLSGILIYQGNDPNGTASTGNVIGGLTAATRNVISGNAQYGIGMRDSLTTGNVIEGNYIGTSRDGSTAQGNLQAGIVIYLGAHANTIGGTVAGTRNVISGNSNQGVFIGDAGSNSNLIQGNYIGTNATGTAAVPNGVGTLITNAAQSNVIGGTSTAARNIISGNLGDGAVFSGAGTSSNLVQGNYIGLNSDGSAALPNQGEGIQIFGSASSNTIGGTAAGATNVISGNSGDGLIVNGSDGTLIQGNYIGTDPNGSTAMPNGANGIYIWAGSQNTNVGGTTSAARNIISGNSGDGIDLNGATNTLIQGNYIGLNFGGSAAMSNGGSGIALFNGANSNTIGGLTAGAANVVSGNGSNGFRNGVYINGSNNNLVQGNYIGVDATGLVARGNSAEGVIIFNGAQNNTVGGNVPGARNVIAANAFYDVRVSGTGTTGNIILGNYIGLDKNGVTGLANDNNGVAVFGGAQNNIIGGTAAGSRNFIAGHARYGLLIADSGTNANSVQGNTLGLNTNGSPVSNTFAGAAIFGGAQSNMVGGNAIGAGNIIAGNSGDGLDLFDSSTIKNRISQNSIYSNQSQGIGLFTNSNNNQPAPTISSATLSPSLVNSGGIDITAMTSAGVNTIEFFASPSGGDEGQFFIGSVSASGSFSVSISAAVPTGYVVTATATDANGNTSQFSAPSMVTVNDTDSDGIPNNWTTAHFNHATGSAGDKSRAIDDADGDGMTNFQEFLAGTDPKNSASRFAVSSIDRNTGSPRIGFQPVAGKTYRLDYRDNLNFGDWITLIDGIFAPNNSTIQINDPTATGLAKRFYRLDLEP